MPTADRRPTVVLLVGEPGSGKTTLGTRLARTMRIPFLARDDVRTGMYFTNGAWTDRPGELPGTEQGHDVFLDAVEALTRLGVSLVVEFVVRRSRPGDLDRLRAAAEVVVVRTSCADAADRRAARRAEDRLLARPAVRAALGLGSTADQVLAQEHRMARVHDDAETEFDLPLLEVDTSTVEPDLDPIIDFVTGAR